MIKMRFPLDNHGYTCPTKPATRWWWFASWISEDDIRTQLDWLKAKGFGGVEIAWVYPQVADMPSPPFLSDSWEGPVVFAKRYSDQIGLGCDFTFGTLWPFGGSFVHEEDAAKTLDGLSSQVLGNSWEQPWRRSGYVIDHLSCSALRNYSAVMGEALRRALEGRVSAVFCDSLEIETDRMWTDGLWDEFLERFGYDLREFQDSLDQNEAVRYDYRKLIAETILVEFYREFTSICHELGGVSRVQCHGAPTDLLAAYASVDIPETEAVLFPPHFGRIASSAAALSGRSIVSSETFTCLYGFPAKHLGEEQVADMKLLADALFAHGVNHIIWHGTPFATAGRNDRFFATVHVGRDSAFAGELAKFNGYMESVCRWMRLGRPIADLAVYLPNEDMMMRGRLPLDQRTPGAGHHWEMRDVRMPDEVEGYFPIWVSNAFLKDAHFSGGQLHVGETAVQALYVNSEWLDDEALTSVLRLAQQGTPVVLRRRPKQPGWRKAADYQRKIRAIECLPNVHRHVAQARLEKTTDGDRLPPCWARRIDDDVLVFFANPKTREIRYPMTYGMSRCDSFVTVPICVRHAGKVHHLDLVFEPHQSLLYRFTASGKAVPVDIVYHPSTPVKELPR